MLRRAIVQRLAVRPGIEHEVFKGGVIEEALPPLCVVEGVAPLGG